MKSKNTVYITPTLVFLKQRQSKILPNLFSATAVPLPSQSPMADLLGNFPHILSALKVHVNVVGGSNEQVKVGGVSNVSNPIRGLVKHALSLKE